MQIESEAIAEPELSPSSMNGLLRISKSKTDNLTQSLINANESQNASTDQHRVIEVNDVAPHEERSSKLLTDDIATSTVSSSRSDIKMISMNGDGAAGIDEDVYRYSAGALRPRESCLSMFLSSICSCRQRGQVSLDFQGKNLVCCHRHMVTGPFSQYCSMLLTLALIGFPVYGFHWVLVKVWLHQQHNTIAYAIMMVLSIPLTMSALYFLFKTNFTDPGIIPRATKEQPMYGPLNEYDRFCTTCYVVRASKAKHCSICDNCVNGFDHHCPWVGTCVAERNLRYFVGFVTSTGLLAMYVGLVCLANLFASKLKLSTTVGLVDIVLLIFTAIIACMLIGMGGDYFFMIGNQITLNEKIKYGHRVVTAAQRQSEQRDEIRTSQRSRFTSNICSAFCAPLAPSQIFVET